MRNLLISFLLALILFSRLTYSQKPQPILPYEKVTFGEELKLKMRLIDKDGNPIIGATVKAYSDFFTVSLYDDGKHGDNNANDGIYGNSVLANTSIGTHTVTVIYTKDEFSDTIQFSVQIVQKFEYELYLYSALIAIAFICIAIFVWRRIKEKELVKRKIEKLEEKKRSIEELIKKTEEAFFEREMEEETFKETVEKYRQSLREIDLELKKLKEKE